VQQEGARSRLTRPGPRILVIRRDNIGDLVCTTPLLRALRAQLPQAWIAALVNRYNAPVLLGNPDLDDVFTYCKAKHREPGESLLGLHLDRLRTVARLRALRVDWALLPGGPQPSAKRFARWISPAHCVARDADISAVGAHEAEQACSLLARMGLRYETPAARIVADAAAAREIRARFADATQVIGVHISARKPSQRWPVERFASLIERFPAGARTMFLLLWAPGSERNPWHPGDDEKAARVVALVPNRRLLPIATQRLDDLIAALSVCDHVVCSDGGAMHLAAALGKPIVCLFGDSDAARWHPWATRYELLQPLSRNVNDIAVEQVIDAYQRLCGAPAAVQPNSSG